MLTAELWIILLQLPVPKTVPYFTVFDIQDDNTSKHAFVHSSSASQEVTCFTSGGGKLDSKSFFATTSHHFLGPLVPSVLDLGVLCPWVLKPGWMKHNLHSFLAFI